MAIQLEVSKVQIPAPYGLTKSLSVMDSQPTANPARGPPTTPPTMTRKATGLTFGGPQASANLKATFAAESEAMRAKSLVLLGKLDATWVDHPDHTCKAFLGHETDF
jgi:hypothetical protein